MAWGLRQTPDIPVITRAVVGPGTGDPTGGNCRFMPQTPYHSKVLRDPFGAVSRGDLPHPPHQANLLPPAGFTPYTPT